MIIETSLCGGAFENLTGYKWTWGISRFRQGEEFNLRYVRGTTSYNGRWHFEMAGKKFSCKKFTPSITDIRMYEEQ